MSWLRNLSLSAKRNRRSVFFSLWSVDENAVGDWFPRASEKCSSIRLMKLQKLNVHVQKMRIRKTLILIFWSFISFKEIKNLILVYCRVGVFTTFDLLVPSYLPLVRRLKLRWYLRLQLQTSSIAVQSLTLQHR